ncbi:11910_t:CDS:2, partial [Acaulospora morrowiae]
LSVSDAEIAELKRRNIEFLRANEEYNERRDAKEKKLEARIAIVEQNDKEATSEVLPEISAPNNNADIKSSEDKKTDSFLDEVHKKKDLSVPKGPAYSVDKESRSHKKKKTENIVQDVFDFIMDGSEKKHMTEFRLRANACTAENERVKANQAEFYEIMIKEKVSTKKAKRLIYDFILAHNPDIKRNTLYQRINRARKVYDQIQTIVDYFSKNPNAELPDDQEDSIIDFEEEISDDQTNASEAVSAESTLPIPVSYDLNSSGPVNADDGNPNSINGDSDSDDSEEEMHRRDDSDDDGYNGYGGYNEYGECDRAIIIVMEDTKGEGPQC